MADVAHEATRLIRTLVGEIPWFLVAIITLVLVCILLFGVFSVHMNQPWLLLPYGIFSTVVLLVALYYLVLVVLDILGLNKTLNNFFTALYLDPYANYVSGYLLAFLAVVVVLEVWFLYITWKCFWYLYNRRKAVSTRKRLEQLRGRPVNGATIASQHYVKGYAIENGKPVQVNWFFS